MSAYQHWDLAMSLWGLSFSILSLMITILSGYLVVAYMIGSKLKSTQVAIINFIYIGVSVFFLLSLLESNLGAIQAQQLAYEMSLKKNPPPETYAAFFVFGFFVIAHLATLWFMWTFRKDNISKEP